jgi:hypothetical protein
MTNSYYSDLRQKIKQAYIANYPGSTPSNQFLDDCMMLMTEERSAVIVAVKEPTLQDVIDAGQFPTPAEYEKMIWMLRWYKESLKRVREQRNE